MINFEFGEFVIWINLGSIIGIVLSITFKLIKNFYNERIRLVLFLISSTLYRYSDIRVSMAYLFRIKINGKYLLVKGDKINQYQAVGGALKFYDSAKKFFEKINVTYDDSSSIGSKNENDLRIKLKGRNIPKILSWFFSRTDREINYYRELNEEIFEPLQMDPIIFCKLEIKYLKTIFKGIKYNQRYNCKQLWIAEILEIQLTKEQKLMINDKIKTNNSYILATRDDIEKHIIEINGRENIISENAISIVVT